MLTQKQKDLLMFIHQRLQDTGVPPSFDEMKDALSLKSKSGIHRLITALEERGFIRRLPHRARAVEILRLPDTVESAAQKPRLSIVGGKDERATKDAPERAVARTSAMPTSTMPPPASPNIFDTNTVSVPMMGRIAAGVPISAIQDHSHDIACPPDLLTNGDHYALEVRGDSMIEAGILDGDTVIIRSCESAENGTIVVALIENEEATLKRIRKRGSTIALEAANPAYETRILGADQVKVQGRIVGLLRRF